MSDETMSSEYRNDWLAHLAHIGVKAERMSPTGYREITVDGLEALTRLHRAPVLKNPLPSPIRPGADPEKIPNDLLVQAVRWHAMGLSVIQDPNIKKEIDRRFETFQFDVHAAQDIDVTSTSPLIINNNSIATYNEVRIHPGGYIRITAPCNFKCNVLKKVGAAQASGAVTEYDIQVAGLDGKDVVANENYWKEKNGADGEPWKDRAKDAKQECDGQGHPGHAGQAGRPGLPGKPGDSGGNGHNGPDVVFTISVLANSVTALNRGGRGGNGGPGGKGGNGGRGQDGGWDAKCGLYWQKGGAGGDGANGANGANGGPGGDGGNGGKVIFKIAKAVDGAKVIATDAEAPGGVGGQGGQVGSGGDAGTPGNHGAAGKHGANGTVQGVKGADGSKGKAGQTLINPETV